MTSKYPLSYHQSMNLEEVFSIYEDRLKLVEGKMRDLFSKNVPVISLIGNYILSSGGKRLRPLFHLISADLAGYQGSAHIEIASIVELIHTASLLHDDVVDMAEVRRGKPTANSTWGNQIVVLVGDFLYSNALRAAVMQRNQRIMETLSAATTRMTEGELLQLNRIGDPGITENEYYDIISAKTGALIAAACSTGAILGGLAEDRERALREFGIKIGMVFQMADDILDYMANENDLGKKLGKDLGEGKITLPLLHLLSVAAADEAEAVREILKHEITAEGLSRIMDLLKQHRSIEASFVKAQSLKDEAKAELLLFPESAARTALSVIADYALHRER